MAFALPNAATFSEVTRDSLLQAGQALGLLWRICARELDRMAAAPPAVLETLTREIEADNVRMAEAVRPFLGGQSRLIRVVQHVSSYRRCCDAWRRDRMPAACDLSH